MWIKDPPRPGRRHFGLQQRFLSIVNLGIVGVIDRPAPGVMFGIGGGRGVENRIAVLPN